MYKYDIQQTVSPCLLLLDDQNYVCTYLDSNPSLEFSLLQGNIWGQIVNQQPLHWTFFNNFVIKISVIAKLYAIFHHYLSIVLVGGTTGKQ